MEHRNIDYLRDNNMKGNDCQFCSGEEQDVRRCKQTCAYTEYLARVDIENDEV